MPRVSEDEASQESSAVHEHIVFYSEHPLGQTSANLNMICKIQLKQIAKILNGVNYQNALQKQLMLMKVKLF